MLFWKIKLQPQMTVDKKGYNKLRIKCCIPVTWPTYLPVNFRGNMLAKLFFKSFLIHYWTCWPSHWWTCWPSHWWSYWSRHWWTCWPSHWWTCWPSHWWTCWPSHWWTCWSRHFWTCWPSQCWTFWLRD